MPKIIAYKCPWTKKVFRNKENYVQHLNNYRRTHILADVNKRKLLEFSKEIRQLSSLNSIVSWIEQHQAVLNCLTGKEYCTDVQIRITKFNIRWNDSVINTHHCPEGGVENFFGLSHLPKGYPGWLGLIEFEYLDQHRDFSSRRVDFSNIMSRLGILTGSGYCNNVSGRYDVRLFDSDWPGLAKTRTLHHLSNRTPPLNYNCKEEQEHV